MVVAMGEFGVVAVTVPSESMVAAATRTCIAMAWIVGVGQL
jgi:hypothetical protein